MTVLEPGQRVVPNPDSPFVTRWEECISGVIIEAIPPPDMWSRHAYTVKLDNGVSKYFHADELAVQP